MIVSLSLHRLVKSIGELVSAQHVIAKNLGDTDVGRAIRRVIERPDKRVVGL